MSARSDRLRRERSAVRRPLWLTVLALLGLPGTAWPQAPDSLRARYRLPQLPTFEVPARGAEVAPGISIGTPSAFGASWGDGVVGFGFQARTRLADHPDGVGAVALGLGDSRRAAGLELALTSYGTLRSCCRGGLSLKAHRALPRDAAVALGWENGVVWGRLSPHASVATDAGTSVYAVASQVIHLRPGRADAFRTLTLTAGIGNGRFRRERDIIAGRERLNLFGSGALRVLESASVVADWTGQDLVAGVSLVPIRGRPLIVMPGFADLTTSPRFILGGALGFDYTRFFRSQGGAP